MRFDEGDKQFSELKDRLAKVEDRLQRQGESIAAMRTQLFMAGVFGSFIGGAIVTFASRMIK